MIGRLRPLLGAAAIGALVLSGCGSTGPTGPQATKQSKATEQSKSHNTNAAVPEDVAPTPVLPTVTTNPDGSTTKITDISRIVPLWGNLNEIVFALGLGDHVVARDVTATFPQADGLPVITQGHDVSAESVLAQRPSLVLAAPDTGPPEALDQLRKAGVPVLVVKEPNSIEDVQTRILTVADALGVPEEGKKLANRTMAQITKVQAAIPKGQPAPRVAFLYMRGQAGVYLLGGPDSGADSMINAAGGADAGTAMGLKNPFTPLTSEALVKAAPEVILMTTTGLNSVGGLKGLKEIPGIAQTPAGVSGRVITMEDGLLYSYGSRTPEALTELIGKIHNQSGT